MGYKITYSDCFVKNYKKLGEKEKNQVRVKVKKLAENPFHPSLRTKKIQGTEDLFECSVNMDIRIGWCYDADKIILLIDLGQHKILKKY